MRKIRFILLFPILGFMSMLLLSSISMKKKPVVLTFSSDGKLMSKIPDNFSESSGMYVSICYPEKEKVRELFDNYKTAYNKVDTGAFWDTCLSSEECSIVLQSIGCRLGEIQKKYPE